MEEIWADVRAALTTIPWKPLARALLLLVIGWPVARWGSRAVGRLAERALELQRASLLRRAAFYLVLALFGVAALHQLGFKLGVLLGAAGVVSVAIGFASQTSASNIVSGIFLVAEKPFDIGDVVQVGGTTGEVLAIDLLAVRLRTFDNSLVRIPNETLIKSEVRNLTRFPIRRIDLKLGVAYKEDLTRVREILVAIADRNPLCLDEPRPVVLFVNFGDSSLDLQFSVWAERSNYIEVKNRISEEAKEALEAAGIEIPFPQRTLSAGSTTQPLPVRVVP